jgi:hypothetical protein
MEDATRDDGYLARHKLARRGRRRDGGEGAGSVGEVGGDGGETVH